MSGLRKVIVLLQDIQRDLKNGSSEDLRKTIVGFLKEQRDKREEINFVINSTASHFSITTRKLKFSSSQDCRNARKFAYCLLHFDVELPIRHISKRIFQQKGHASVYNAVRDFKTLNTNIKTDKEFKAVYEKLQRQLGEHLNEKNKHLSNGSADPQPQA